MDSDSRRQLLADIASQYFLEKKTQSEIARASGYSRSAISRMLSEAEELGIIEIKIKYPLLCEKNMERSLKQIFSLESAFVVNSGLADYSHNINLVGRLGASYLQNNILDNMIIGIGWGSSLYELVNALPFTHRSNIQVVQVIGASGGKSDVRVDGPDLAALLASKLNASHKFLHSPLFLDSEKACLSMKDQKQIKNTLELGYESDIVLLGIGTIDVDPVYSSIFRSGFIGEKEVECIKDQGGVANFCGVILDREGKVIDNELNKRTMAVDIQRLRLNGCKFIGIAAGSQKSQAIEAVLKGKWLDILFTDTSATFSILQKQNLEVL